MGVVGKEAGDVVGLKLGCYRNDTWAAVSISDHRENGTKASVVLH